MDFSLDGFAHHLAHLAKHIADDVIREARHGHGGGAAGGGGSPEGSILAEGAKIIEAEVVKGLSGSNPFGLAPLAPSTIARKGSDRFLVETAALQGSVRTSIGEHEAVVGSNDPKVEWLEFGTAKMPPRPTFRTAGQRAEPKIHAMAERKIARAFRF